MLKLLLRLLLQTSNFKHRTPPISTLSTFSKAGHVVPMVSTIIIITTIITWNHGPTPVTSPPPFAASVLIVSNRRSGTSIDGLEGGIGWRGGGWRSRHSTRKISTVPSTEMGDGQYRREIPPSPGWCTGGAIRPLKREVDARDAPSVIQRNIQNTIVEIHTLFYWTQCNPSLLRLPAHAPCAARPTPEPLRLASSCALRSRKLSSTCHRVDE